MALLSSADSWRYHARSAAGLAKKRPCITPSRPVAASAAAPSETEGVSTGLAPTCPGIKPSGCWALMNTSWLFSPIRASRAAYIPPAIGCVSSHAAWNCAPSSITEKLSPDGRRRNGLIFRVAMAAA